MTNLSPAPEAVTSGPGNAPAAPTPGAAPLGASLPVVASPPADTPTAEKTDPNVKPVPLPVIFGNIPKVMQDESRWCTWYYKCENGMWKKPPHEISAYKKQLHEFWDVRERLPRAQAVYADLVARGEALSFVGTDGIGFVVHKNGVPTEPQYALIDLDHCISPDGKFSALAIDVMQTMRSYTEYSPSGQGIHLYCLVKDLPYDRARYLEKADDLEIYVSGHTTRYLTVTGQTVWNLPIEDRTKELTVILEKYMRKGLKQSPQGGGLALPTGNPPVGTILTDEQVIHVASSAKNGKQFRRLFEEGDLSEYYGDASGADMALADFFAFYCRKDKEQMERLMRRSGLCREKWDEPHYTSGELYLKHTIQEAVDGTENVYGDDRIYRPTDFTDVGNAQLFRRVYREQAAYCSALGWLVWTGARWEIDDVRAQYLAEGLSGMMLAQALEELTRIQAELDASTESAVAAIAEADEAERETIRQASEAFVKRTEARRKSAEAFRKHAIKTRSKASIFNLVSLARAGVILSVEALDADPFALNTPGGIVDLKTGGISAHDPSRYCTKITAVAPGSQGADMWAQFLGFITGGDEEMKRYHQMAAGMSAIGKVFTEKLLIANGDGDNGKSTYYNALAAVLGEYSHSIDSEVLTTTWKNTSAALAELQGKRLVIAAELDENRQLSTSTLKRTTSTDKIAAERKYQAPMAFTPTHTLVLFTNHMPKVRTSDSGTWRRLAVVPFDQVITPDKAIKNFGAVLVKEAGPAILQWIIDG
ncbi:MAG: DUF5906 domain-containing protein, partial [Treponema sp.]|nr:DUF5906 domain-containing protein [Treponema sp.]